MRLNINVNIFLIIIVAAGFSMSSLSYWFIIKAEEKSLLIEFQRDVDERAASMYREILVNFEVLQSLSILFHKGTVPELTRFQKEATKIIGRHSGIQALEWIPRVTQSERLLHESKIRKYFPGYMISERHKQGVMAKAEEREEYFPVYYVEPLDGNEAALGFDLASNPRRLQALLNARDKGLAQATASITLVQEREKKKGFLIFLPIYNGNSTTIEQRREELVGFVLGVFNVGDIFISSALSKIVQGIDMAVVDNTFSNEPEILFTYQSHAGLIQKEISYRKELPEIWGRKWLITASPTSSYTAVRQSIYPQLTFTAGIVLTILIVLYIKILARREISIKRIVREKTKALKEANNKLSELSRTDALTGIANRRVMDEFLNREWSRAIRNKSKISFILIDIDYFKNYNDNYGHPSGDECLRKVAKKINSLVNRPGDLMARYGGEEFAIILSDTRNAEMIAGSSRESIEHLQIPHNFSEVSNYVTISVGICTVIPEVGSDSSLIISTADKALYKAKQNGRNKVEKGYLNFNVKDANNNFIE